MSCVQGRISTLKIYEEYINLVVPQRDVCSLKISYNNSSVSTFLVAMGTKNFPKRMYTQSDTYNLDLTADSVVS